MNYKTMCLLNRKVNPLFWLMLICLVTLAVPAQESLYSKDLPDGSKVYLKRQIISEIRSRPESINKGIPESEIFEREEWEIRKYYLFRKKNDSDQESIIWKYTGQIRTDPKDEFPGVGSLNIKDVFVADDNAFVLYVYANVLFVANVTRDDSLGWYEISNTKLAVDYQTRPIQKASFSDRKKAEIAVEFAEKGKRVLWKWKLNNAQWKRS